MDVQVQGPSYRIKRADIFSIWRNLKHASNTNKHQETYEQFLRVFNLPDQPELRDKIQKLCKALLFRWNACKRREADFIQKYGDWLDSSEDFGGFAGSTQRPGERRKRGRPKKSFEQASFRTKRRRLRNVAIVDESLAKELGSTKKREQKSILQVTDALLLLVEVDLSKKQYLSLKKILEEKVNVQCPSYAKVLEAKKESYPNSDSIKVTESSAEVSLQGLLNNTASRLINSLKDVFAVIDKDDFANLILLGKWGFDGSSGQSEYKQRCVGDYSDSDLFMTSYVPLQLFCPATAETEKKIVWQNPRPGSVRFCRPIRFQLKKETTDLCKAEQAYIEDQIQALTPTTLNLIDTIIKVTHELKLTMVDGKVCNSLTDTTSSQVCYLCGCKPTEMNDIETCRRRVVKQESLKFGISPLHAWIRFFEFLLHVSYRLDFKKWRTGQAEKALFTTRKEQIQKDFKKKTGLIVDKPKQGGGNSNDGNTARRFFANPSLTSEVTGIDQNIIDRCGTLLRAMASGYQINVQVFDDYALETARLIVSEYPWYPLPASVHKVLIHGAQIIQHAILPIGQLTEEAAEAKNVKSFRRKNTRKSSRLATNEDLLNRLLLSSDPFLSNNRPLPRKPKSTFNRSVLNLLV